MAHLTVLGSAVVDKFRESSKAPVLKRTSTLDRTLVRAREKEYRKVSVARRARGGETTPDWIPAAGV